MSQTLSKAESTSKSHLHNVMQIAVFLLNDKNHYGINVSKIRSFEDFNRYKIIKSSSINSNIMEGYIQYQDKIIPVLNLEKWMDIFVKGNEYAIYLICEFNKMMLAFPISVVDNIYNVAIGDLQRPDAYTGVITYNTVIKIGGKDTTCMVLDVERLIDETFGEDLGDIGENMGKEKLILVAEDSGVARSILREILESSSLRVNFYNDGMELRDYLSGLDAEGIEDIGLIITDLEMPRLDGYQVIKYVKENKSLAGIPVIVNSSMSNSGVDVKVKSLGASGFVAKTSPEELLRQIKDYML